jgi:hypothetical protein
MTYEQAPPDAHPVARAYVYSGDWVGDCPRPCGNVEFLHTPSRMNGPRDTPRAFYLCSNCGMQAPISWPDHMNEILQVLMLRPIPQTRNWYPKDHPVAVNFRLPHGQSVRDLLSENEEHQVDNTALRGLR